MEISFADFVSLIGIQFINTTLNTGKGSWRRVGLPGQWKNTIAGVEHQGLLYSVELNGGLFATNFVNGQWVLIKPLVYANTMSLFSNQSWIYSIEANGNLYQLEPSSGAWARIGEQGAWKNTIAAAVDRNIMVSAELNGSFVLSSMLNGSRIIISPSGYNLTKRLFITDKALYSLEANGNLYGLNPLNGKFWQVGQSSCWKNTIVATNCNEIMYSVEADGGLYMTHLPTGKFSQLGSKVFINTKFLFASGDFLYSIEIDGSLYEIRIK